MMLHHILTDSQIAAAIFATPFVLLAAVFAVGSVAISEPRTAQLLRSDRNADAIKIERVQ